MRRIPRRRRAAFLVLLPLLSLTLFLATGEIALRVIYRDAGRATLGGPGGRDFDHLFIQGEQRGRFDEGRRTAGVPRLLIVGDSITWGQGVRDWRNVWTEKLATALEQRGPVELAVVAAPGRGITEHIAVLDRYGERVQPDVIIYQWYVNDLEVIGERPRNERIWQRWPMHRSLRQSSYLYFFLDHRLSALLPQPERSYQQYILDDFAPGRPEWTEYVRMFDEFSARAKALAPARVLILYPQVPFRGAYPLQPVNDRMRELAAKHEYRVVDLTDAMNTFNTHASIFDAHPNEQAHAVIAEHVLKAIEELPSLR
jgi:lysophospholipase L1-like esterase